MNGQKVYVLYRIDQDDDANDWQQFDGVFSTREKAQESMESKRTKDKLSWGFNKDYEIEEETIDREL